MAVALVSTGVQFPDSTIQTTAAASGGFSNIAVFTSSGTWSVPSGVTKARVIVTGGGGGTGNSGLTTGANAGGTAIKIVSSLIAGNTASVTVGAGGPSNSGTDGKGGTSQFYYSVGAVVWNIYATGGGNGATNSGAAYGPGVGSGGDINLYGGNNGAVSSYAPVGDCGGASYWGGGSSASWGNSRVGAYGSGGTGSNNYSLWLNGNSGIVVIEY